MQRRQLSYKIWIIALLLCGNFSYGFQKKDSIAAIAVLNKVQEVYSKTNQYRFDVDYTSYGSYEDNEVLEHYKGKIYKSSNTFYSKTQNTIILSDANKSLKIYEDEKAIEVYDNSTQVTEVQNPTNINAFLKHYKQITIEEKDKLYICTLQTGYITQMPYGKIVLYINKENYTIIKQDLFLLARLPYYTKSGEKKMGNPRIEISFSNFKKQLNTEEQKSIKLSTYITIKGSTIIGNQKYKDFSIDKI